MICMHITHKNSYERHIRNRENERVKPLQASRIKTEPKIFLSNEEISKNYHTSGHP